MFIKGLYVIWISEVQSVCERQNDHKALVEINRLLAETLRKKYWQYRLNYSFETFGS